MDTLKTFTSTPKQGVYVIGHASALARVGGRLYMFDPCWGDYKPYGDHWVFWPEQVDASAIASAGEIHECFVSHVHEDHVCLKALSLMPAVNICKGVMGLSEKLKTLDNVNEWAPWKWHRTHSQTEFMFTPSANGIDCGVYVRDQRTGYTVYHGNDCFLQEPELMRTRELVERVDVAMLPYASINWYPELMEMPERKKRVEHGRVNIETLAWLERYRIVMRPVTVVPTGNSLFYRGTHTGARDHVLNKHLLTPYDVLDSLPLLAGDYVLEDQSFNMVMRQTRYRESLPAESLENMWEAAFRKKVFNASGRADEPVDGHIIVIRGIPVGEVWVDPASSECGVGDYRPTRDKVVTCFNVEPFTYEKWWRGELSFEEMVGTREFTCWRKPDVYNPAVSRWLYRNL